jgi:hypothetical protein
MADQQQASQIFTQAEFDAPASQRIAQMFVQVEFGDPPQGQRIGHIFMQFEQALSPAYHTTNGLFFCHG